MKRYSVQASAPIHAPAKVVYSIIADYRNGHPHILPPYFSNLVVDEGGFGAGTRIGFDMTLMGNTQHYRASVSEPEPGRVLMEDNGPEAGSATTFTVDPQAQGAESQVTIVTTFTQRPGLSGRIERFLIGIFLPRVYAQELQLLDKVARQRYHTGNLADVSVANIWP